MLILWILKQVWCKYNFRLLKTGSYLMLWNWNDVWLWYIWKLGWFGKCNQLLITYFIDQQYFWNTLHEINGNLLILCLGSMTIINFLLFSATYYWGYNGIFRWMDTNEPFLFLVHVFILSCEPVLTSQGRWYIYNCTNVMSPVIH